MSPRLSLTVEIRVAADPSRGLQDHACQALRMALGLTLRGAAVQVLLRDAGVGVLARDTALLAQVDRYIAGLRARGHRIVVEAESMQRAGVTPADLAHDAEVVGAEQMEELRAGSVHVFSYGSAEGRALFSVAESTGPGAGGDGCEAAALADRVLSILFDEEKVVATAPKVEDLGEMRGGASTTRSSLDLCGERCPMTFVRTKLALEELRAGDELRVVLDNPDSAGNVPRACRAEGHEVVSVSGSERGRWEVVIRRGPLTASQREWAR